MKKTLTTLLYILFSIQIVLSQNKIRGLIKEGEDMKHAIAAEIQVFKFSDTVVYQSTYADEYGYYELDLKDGTYDIQILYEDYVPYRVNKILIQSNADTTIDIVLIDKYDSQTFNEVVVLGQQSQNSIYSLYQIQKQSLTMSDGISQDIISKSSDRHTGEVLKRVSGTSIQDNKFVIVRGMSDRYNLSLMDGAILPGTEPNRKTFSFDAIPSSVIDNIVIHKTANAELPGEFSGGLISIQTKDMPNQPYSEINLGIGFHSNSTFKDFYSGKLYGNDFLGFDAGNRSLPEGFPSFQEMNQKYASIGSKESKLLLSQLNNDYKIYHKKSMPGIQIQYAHGNVFTLNDFRKIGYQIGISYQHDELIRPDIIRQYDNYDYKDNVYFFRTNIGALFNATYLSTHSKISFKSLYNRNFENQHLQRQGINYGTSTEQKYTAFDLFEKSILKSTLMGNHKIAETNQIDWLVSYNYVMNNRPDQKKITYSKLLGEDGLYFAELATMGKSNSRLYGELQEHVVHSNVKYTFKIPFFNNSEMKIGLDEQYRFRSFSNRYLGAVINSSHPHALDILTMPIESIFTNQMIEEDYFRFSEQTIDGDFYNAYAMTSSGFVLFTQDLNNLKLVYGIRGEMYNTELSSIKKKEVDKQWFSLLPSASIIYMVDEKNQIRASYAKTIARPEFREMANMAYYDYELNAIFTGNSTLKPTDIHNLDLKFENFIKNGEIFSTTIFYKRFTNTIENSVYASNTAYEVTPRNFSKGYNLGIEVEYRKRLEDLFHSYWISNSTFYLNASYTHSSIHLPENYYIMGKIQTHRPLSGQSPFVMNTGLYFQDPNNRYSINILYNFIGRNLYMIGNDRLSNVYLNERHLLDLNCSFEINKNLSVRLSVKDILNSPFTYFMDQNVNGKFENNWFIDGQIKVDEDWIWQKYKPGTSYGLSIKYKM